MPISKRDDAPEDAGLYVKKPHLTLSNPLMETYMLHPSNLCLKIDTSELWWQESIHPRNVPTRVGAWETAEGCLDAFFRLHDATDEQILKFAGRWGILGIWPLRRKQANPNYRPEHDVHADWPEDPTEDMFPNGMNDRHIIWTVESTDLWRRLASHFRKLLMLAADLQTGRETEGDWEGAKQQARRGTDPAQNSGILAPWHPGFRHKGKTYEQAHRDEQWDTVRFALSRWAKQVPLFLSVGEAKAGGGKESVVRLSLNEMPTNWTVEMYQRCEEQGQREWSFDSDLTFYRDYPYTPMRSSALLNVLVVQIIGAVTSRVYVCASCQQPFKSERRLRSDKARLCTRPECKQAQVNQRVKKCQQNRKAQAG